MTMTIEKYDEVAITHEKLQNSLQNYMRIMGTRGYFKYSEELEKRIKNLKLVLREEENSCYTNFRAVFIGLLFEYIKNCKSLDEQYNMARIIIAHEVAHLRFTKQKDWNSYCHRSHGKYKKLSRFAIDILNIVEDGRIEYHMSKVSPKVKRGFKYLRALMAKDIQKTFDEIDGSKPMNPAVKLMHIQNGLLYIVCSLKVPTIPNEEIMEVLRKAWPLLIYSRKTKSTAKAVKVADKIMELIAPIRDEYDKKVEEKMKGKYDSKSAGTDDAMEDDEIDEMDDMLEPEEVDDTLPKEIKDLIEELEEKAKELMDEESEEAPPSPSSLEGLDDEDCGEETSYAPIPGGKGDEEDTMEDSKPSDKESKSEHDVEKEDTSSDATSSKTGEEPTESSSEEETRHLEDIIKDLEEKMAEREDDMEDLLEEELRKVEREYKEPITADILNDYLHSDTKLGKEKITEEKETKSIHELEPTFDKELHDGCVAEFKPKQELAKFTPFEYSQLNSSLLALEKKTAKELRTLADYQLETTLRFQRRGRLDRRSIVNIAATKETKVFRKQQIDVVQMKMDVMLLVDGSGSKRLGVPNPKNNVSIPRYEMDRIVSIFLHETLKRTNFPHAVWWFDEVFSTKRERFASMVDFGNCFHKNSGLYLKDIHGYNDNRDGFSIAYAGEYLRKRGTSDKKLLIVLSDGLPAAKGYGGTNAKNDVYKTIMDLEKKGVKTIGIFTGAKHENPSFGSMYPNHLFVNNESIFDLPKKLKEILVREFKEHLSSI